MSGWEDFAVLVVEVGTGDSSTPSTTGIWGSSLWGRTGAVWSGLEPKWHDVTCRATSVAVTRGRERWIDRIGASTCQVDCENRDGWLTWNRTAQGPLEMRVGRQLRVRMITVADGVSHDLWRGFVAGIDDDYLPFTLPTATIGCEDGMAQIGHVDLPEGPVVGTGERSDQRIGRVLDSADWPAAWRELAQGQITVQGTNLARNLADEAGITADSEGGAVYSHTNGNVRFQNRDWLRTAPYAQTVQATIGPGGTVCGSEHTVVVDGGDIVNDVQMGRAGGTALRMVDQDSIALYRRRTYQRTDLICQTDPQVQLLAERLLDTRSVSQSRLTGVTVPVVDAASAMFAATVDYGWRLTVAWQAPDGSDSWSRDVLVMGQTHRISPSSWDVTLAVDDATMIAPAFAWGAGRWGSARWTEAS